MTSIVVGISDYKVSSDPDSLLLTFALGSCIGVAIADIDSRMAGLLHFMLPDSSLHGSRGGDTPCMFADTGVPLLLKRMRDQGAKLKNLHIILAGGAQILDEKQVFQIGKRNHLAARKALWAAGLMVSAEATGGTVSRTVRMEVGSGRVWLREGDAPDRLIAPTDRKSSKVAALRGC
jgi:chemotaxis protein CheD